MTVSASGIYLHRPTVRYSHAQQCVNRFTSLEVYGRWQSLARKRVAEFHVHLTVAKIPRPRAGVFDSKHDERVRFFE